MTGEFDLEDLIGRAVERARAGGRKLTASVDSGIAGSWRGEAGVVGQALDTLAGLPGAVALSASGDGKGTITLAVTLRLDTAAAAVEVLDPRPLDTLESLVGRTELKRLVDTYLTNAADQLARLERFVAARDHAQLSMEAHKIIGLSGNFGAHRVGPLARRLEDACKQEDSDLDGLLAALRRESEAAWSAIRRRVDAVIPG